MKNFMRCTLTLAAAWTLAQVNSTLFAQDFGGGVGGRRDIALTIHADGSCEVESLTVMGRPAVEQSVRIMEAQQKVEEAAEAGDMAQIANLLPQARTNTFTDEQLKEKYIAMMEEQSSMPGEEEAVKPNVAVDKDNVTVTSKETFTSIKEMLQSRSTARLVGVGPIYCQNMRFEQDTNGHLMLTLTPMAGMKRQVKNMRTEMKMTGVSGELKFVFAGKVLSSGLPETQTNATWIAVDSKKDESLDALAKLYNGPIVITAEPAGLTLKEPLELKKLRPCGGRTGGVGDDLPITEGGAGFVAQAEGIMTTTLHVFPGGENYFKEGNNPSGEQAGTMVHAKLFAPKGRSLQSVTDVKLLTATDDKGRAVAAGKNDEGEEMNSFAFVQSGMEESQENNGAEMQLRLQLPQPDAQAIDELSAEAVAVTAGSWKEMTLTNITETSTNEFDLGGVLPGAKLVISKFSNKNNMLTMQVQIKGPATVKNLKVQAKVPGSEQGRGYSNSSEGNVRSKGGETTRTLQINASIFNQNGAKVSGPFQLLLRYPQDLKRERVNFKLKGLDLL